MSDLIIRKEVRNLMCLLHMDNTSINGKNIKTFIDELPTAYNIDNVVAELKNISFKATRYPDSVVDLNEAIEMVMRGGVADIQQDSAVDCSCMYIDRSRV